ncbi:hypothetical protein DAI22_07g222200 [Oryza sativa Japonica Group]|nr:hypothetical protein DAI22_07g222200 [Oryza sativa Japonica Group]
MVSEQVAGDLADAEPKLAAARTSVARRGGTDRLPPRSQVVARELSWARIVGVGSGCGAVTGGAAAAASTTGVARARREEGDGCCSCSRGSDGRGSRRGGSAEGTGRALAG